MSEAISIDALVASARAEIEQLKIAAAAKHDEIDRLRAEKNLLTRKITALEQFVDSQRPPNPKGMSRIG